MGIWVGFGVALGIAFAVAIEKWQRSSSRQ
jgi:hypothetical protein